jgi:hypothetical protein
MASTEQIIAPKRGDEFVDRNGVPNSWPQRWIEQITRVSNSNNTSIFDRLDKLEPQFVSITVADSPYTPTTMDYIVADTSGGDITIVLGTTERLFVSKESASNKVILQGTVNGATDPEILFDGTGIALFYDGSEHRYI